MKKEGIKLQAKATKPSMSEKLRGRKLAGAKGDLNWYKKGKKGRKLLHSEEKVFLLDQHRNSRRDRFLATKDELNSLPRSVTTVEKTKNCQKVMVLAVVGEDGGKAPLIIVGEN